MFSEIKRPFARASRAKPLESRSLGNLLSIYICRNFDASFLANQLILLIDLTYKSQEIYVFCETPKNTSVLAISSPFVVSS